MKHVALIGYGEVGRILAEDLRQRGVGVTACDIKLAASDAAAPSMREHAAVEGVTLHAEHGKAVANAELVICAVTASQTVAAAQACCGGLKPGAFYLDMNSASPGAKCEAARRVEAVGANYVEGAVMTSVPPYRSRVPLILGGPHGPALAPALEALGFAPRTGPERLGIASATKMCRSVMIKGLEALVIESFTAARAFGVEDAMLASLKETFPGIDWEKQGSYFFQRVIEHGRRRGEEMREAAQTLREVGLEPWSASASVERDESMADFSDAGAFGIRGSPDFARSADWRIEADRLLAAVKEDRT